MKVTLVVHLQGHCSKSGLTLNAQRSQMLELDAQEVGDLQVLISEESGASKTS